MKICWYQRQAAFNVNAVLALIKYTHFSVESCCNAISVLSEQMQHGRRGGQAGGLLPAPAALCSHESRRQAPTAPWSERITALTVVQSRHQQHRGCSPQAEKGTGQLPCPLAHASPSRPGVRPHPFGVKSGSKSGRLHRGEPVRHGGHGGRAASKTGPPRRGADRGGPGRGRSRTGPGPRPATGLHCSAAAAASLLTGRHSCGQAGPARRGLTDPVTAHLGCRCGPPTDRRSLTHTGPMPPPTFGTRLGGSRRGSAAAGRVYAYNAM